MTPSHFAYNVRNREGGDNYWIRIDSAWAHAHGNGFNIQLEINNQFRHSTGLGGLSGPPFFVASQPETY
jgi:hypothetical protein